MILLCGLVKAIARLSLTELNIITFHDGLINISYCHYDQQEKLENNYKTLFWKSQNLKKKKKWKKQTYTHARTPRPSVCFVRISMTPFPSTANILFEWPLCAERLTLLLGYFQQDIEFLVRRLGTTLRFKYFIPFHSDSLISQDAKS